MSVGIIETNIQKLLVLSVTLTPAQVNANTAAEQTFTVTGVRSATDVILEAAKPTTQAGLGIGNVRVSADNTVAIEYINDTASPITPTSEAYKITLARVDGANFYPTVP